MPQRCAHGLRIASLCWGFWLLLPFGGGLVLRSARVRGAQWFYLAYSSIEILLCGVIVWLAWRWPKLH